jgi:hypothetical protein
MVTTPSSRKTSHGLEYGATRLLILLLIVGVGALAWYWIDGRDSTPARTESAPAPAAEPAATGSTALGHTRTASASTETVYVVASEEAAGYLRGMLSEAEAIAIANGDRPAPSSVIVLDAGRSAEELYVEQQMMMPNELIPQPAIVDLRPAVGQPPAGPDGTFPIDPDTPGFVP